MSILSDYKEKKLSTLKRLAAELREVLEDDELTGTQKYNLIFDARNELVNPALADAKMNEDYFNDSGSPLDNARAYVNMISNLVGI